MGGRDDEKEDRRREYERRREEGASYQAPRPTVIEALVVDVSLVESLGRPHCRVELLVDEQYLVELYASGPVTLLVPPAPAPNPVSLMAIDRARAPAPPGPEPSFWDSGLVHQVKGWTLTTLLLVMCAGLCTGMRACPQAPPTRHDTGPIEPP